MILVRRRCAKHHDGVQAFDAAEQLAQLLRIAFCHRSDFRQEAGEPFRFQSGRRKVDAQFLCHFCRFGCRLDNSRQHTAQARDGTGSRQAACRQRRDTRQHFLHRQAQLRRKTGHLTNLRGQLADRRFAQVLRRYHAVQNVIQTAARFRTPRIVDGGRAIDDRRSVRTTCLARHSRPLCPVRRILRRNTCADGIIGRACQLRRRCVRIIAGIYQLIRQVSNLLLPLLLRAAQHTRKRRHLIDRIFQLHAVFDACCSHADNRQRQHLARLRRAFRQLVQRLTVVLRIFRRTALLVSGFTG